MESEMEQNQSEVMEHFVKQASASTDATALTSIIVEATSHPSLFAFSEILSLPNLLQLEATEDSVYLDMLRLFAHGTWGDYKSKADCLPELIPDQILKLKQLTVLTLTETCKVLSYDKLMQELDVANVRELEDFLIDKCIYSGIVRGKLDHLRRCFEVHFSACRDLRPAQLGNMIQIVENWLSTSENLLVSIEERIKWADTTSEIDKKHRKDVKETAEEIKKCLPQVDAEFGGVLDYADYVDGRKIKRKRRNLAFEDCNR